MAQIRKTRQQKIQISQRQAAKQDYDLALPSSELQETIVISSPLGNLDSETQATYTYVIDELKRIAWVSVVCIVLLAVASLFLSEMPLIVSAREFLHLPHIQLF